MPESMHSPHPQNAVVALSDADLDGGLTALRRRLCGLVMDGVCLVVIDVSAIDQSSSTLLDRHRVSAGRLLGW